MNIINVRVDGRLVHGQVAMLWSPSLQINRVIVVGDKIASDELGKNALKLAKPAGTNMSIIPVEKAINNLLKDRYREQRLMIVTRELDALIRMKEAGVPIEEVNVGNVSNADGKKTIYKSVFLNEEEVAQFEKLNELGVKLVHQMTPNNAAEDFITTMREKVAE